MPPSTSWTRTCPRTPAKKSGHPSDWDKPLWEQYLIHLKNAVTGNFGVSFGHFPRPVMDVLVERVPRTAVLFLSATVLSFYLGFFLGKAIAWRRGGLLEYTATISGATLFTVFTPGLCPDDDMGLCLPAGLAAGGQVPRPPGLATRRGNRQPRFRPDAPDRSPVHPLCLPGALCLEKAPAGASLGKWALPLISVGGVVALVIWSLSGIGGLALDILKHMVLPIATLTLISFAGTMLLHARNSMLETVREDYVMAARAKGLPEKLVRDRHAARNALLPVVTSLVYSLIFAIDGSVIIEGRLFLARHRLDPLAGGTHRRPASGHGGRWVFIGLFSLLAHVIVDVLYVYLDPRIRYQ